MHFMPLDSVLRRHTFISSDVMCSMLFFITPAYTYSPCVNINSWTTCWWVQHMMKDEFSSEHANFMTPSYINSSCVIINSWTACCWNFMTDCIAFHVAVFHQRMLHIIRYLWLSFFGVIGKFSWSTKLTDISSGQIYLRHNKPFL